MLGPPAHPVVVNQPDVCLIDQRRSLKSVSGSLTPHALMSHSAQFFVDERDQLIQGSSVAAAPIQQQASYIVLREPRHICPLLWMLGRHIIALPKAVTSDEGSDE